MSSEHCAADTVLWTRQIGGLVEMP